MEKHPQKPCGRPRSGEPASAELAALKGLELARFATGCTSGGLSMGATAQLCGTSKRHLQRVIRDHSDDPFVARNTLIASAVAWEQEGAQVLREAASRATSWLRQATSNQADPREVAAAFSAAVASGHRLAEAGARRARRLQPVEQPQAQRFDLEGFLGQIAAACQEVRQLLEAEQERGWEQLRQQLKGDQQGQPIDVEVIEAQGVEPGPSPCPF